MNDVTAAAYDYTADGWRVIPVPYKKKKPVLDDWQLLRLSEDDLAKHFNGHPQNIGILLGAASNGLVDVDADAPEAVQIAQRWLPRTPAISGRRSKRRSHHWYIAPGLDTKQYKDVNGEMLIEVRSTGGQTIVPPSTHPSGEQYEWESSGQPANVDGAELSTAVARIAAAAILAIHWPKKGSRHSASLALAGMLLRGQWSQEAAREFVSMVAAVAGDDEWNERDANIETTAQRLDKGASATGTPTLAELLSMGDKVISKVRAWLELGTVEQQASANGTGSTKATPEDAAQLWGEQYGDTWAYDEEGDTWRRWNGTHWQEERERSIDLSNQAVHVMQALGIPITSQSKINLTIERARSYCRRRFRPRPNAVNFQNGTLLVDAGELWIHTPGDDLFSCLPHTYSQDDYPTITAFLAQTIPDPEARRCYMAHIGLALLGDSRLHKALLLIGPTRSGKSTALKLANAVCGNEPDANAGPELFAPELEGMRSRAAWNGRRMVTLEELPAEALRNEEIFKALTAHAGVSQRRMNVLETTANRWLPKLMMATNEAPRYSDRSGALTQRLVIVRCPNARDEETQDIRLFDTFEPELGAFAGACIAEASALLTAGRYPQSMAMRQDLAAIELHGDNVKLFVSEMCVLDAKVWSATADLYAEYLGYCDENGIHEKYRMQKTRFTEALGQRYPGVSPRLRERDGKKVRAVLGIRMKTQAELDSDTGDTGAIQAPNRGCIGDTAHHEAVNSTSDTGDTPNFINHTKNTTHQTREEDSVLNGIKGAGVSADPGVSSHRKPQAIPPEQLAFVKDQLPKRGPAWARKHMDDTAKNVLNLDAGYMAWPLHIRVLVEQAERAEHEVGKT